MTKQSKKDIRQLKGLDFDLANYFSNTIIPQLFIDSEMILRVFTPPAMTQFSLSYDDIGKHIYEVKDNLRYPDIPGRIEEIIRTGRVLEEEIQTTDGRWFQMNIVPYIEHELDKVNGVILTFVDITSRYTTIKELEKINAENQILKYALSHDLKQPISTIQLLTAAFRETFRSGNEAQFQVLINRLKNASNRLSTLVTEYAAFGGANGQQKESAQQDLKVIFGDVLKALKDEISSNKITVSHQVQSALISFPKNGLRSVIYNLLGNAINYRCRDRAAVIRIETFEDPQYVVFVVEDNGLGIAEEHQAWIFKKSSRLNPEIEGTGMGLFIVKNLIESHGGRIELKSIPGKGSTFQVYFRK